MPTSIIWVRSCFALPRYNLTGIAYYGHPRWHTTLAYDGLDHLVTITEQDGRNIETQHLIWCGEAICGLTDNKGQLITRLFQQGEWRQGQVLYYARDHLGSIRDVLGTLPPLDELIDLASTDLGRMGRGWMGAGARMQLTLAGMAKPMPRPRWLPWRRGGESLRSGGWEGGYLGMCLRLAEGLDRTGSMGSVLNTPIDSL